MAVNHLTRGWFAEIMYWFAEATGCSQSVPSDHVGTHVSFELCEKNTKITKISERSVESC
jgi:hypothetical protein